jgi:pyridoxine 4-dehydrogenase
MMTQPIPIPLLIFIFTVNNLAASSLALVLPSEQQQQQKLQQHSRREFFAQTVAISSASVWIPSGAANAGDVIVSNKKSLDLPPMGLGCWAWGDSLFWGYNPKNDGDLKTVFDYAVENHSPVLIDTAEIYGFGRSESLLGQFSLGVPDDKIVMASKFAALPFRTKPENVLKAAQASVNRQGGKPIDLYQIHFPNSFANEAYWDGMAQAYEKGLIKAVGVSNYGVDALRACHDALAKRGIPLASNQIQYSLLYRFPEQNGLLKACDELGVQVLAYSPLALGLLTGKYTTVEEVKNTVRGPRQQLFAQTVENPQFRSLLATMEDIAASHSTNDRTVNLPQVAINYCRSKGTIPIPGARNLRQVQSNYAALEWELTPMDVTKLDAASDGLAYIDPSASPFPKYDKDTGLKMFDS